MLQGREAADAVGVFDGILPLYYDGWREITRMNGGCPQ